MKYKIIIIIIMGTFLTTLIYIHTEQKKTNLLALGDGISIGMTPYHTESFDFNDYLAENLEQNNNLKTYYKDFNEVDETVNNLLVKISNNVGSLNKKVKIKQAIKEADIITISLGMDELNNYSSKKILGSQKINSFLNKYEKLIKEIRKMNNKKIYIIGLYKSDGIKEEKINKINENIKKVAITNNVNFIDISDIVLHEEYFINKSNYYLNYKGQKYIFDKIMESNHKNVIKVV